MAKFPKDLSNFVYEKWSLLVAGAYEAPPCPPKKILQDILEVCYIVSCAFEETRSLQFNIICLPLGKEVPNQWLFDSIRQLTVSELKRLSPVVDLKKSAVLLNLDADGVYVSGIVDLGTSWHRARMGLGYQYTFPHALVVQADKPGRVKVYQSRFLVATLNEGKIESSFASNSSYHLFLHPAANAGADKISLELEHPDYEHPRDFLEFYFLAIWNTYVAIANSISLGGHGGMLIILSNTEDANDQNLRIKYKCSSDNLRDALKSFLNKRNIMGDLIDIDKDGHWVPYEAFSKTELDIREKYESVVESTRLIAGLAGCDGAVVITDDLRLVGFGAEIRSTMNEGSKIYEVTQELGDNKTLCDIEQFGMRHRSALKLVSQKNDCIALVVSQDGPISGVWNKSGDVILKKGVTLTNANMPLG